MDEQNERSEQGSKQSEQSKAEQMTEWAERCGVNEWANEWPLLNGAVFSISDHSATVFESR